MNFNNYLSVDEFNDPVKWLGELFRTEGSKPEDIKRRLLSIFRIACSSKEYLATIDSFDYDFDKEILTILNKLIEVAHVVGCEQLYTINRGDLQHQSSVTFECDHGNILYVESIIDDFFDYMDHQQWHFIVSEIKLSASQPETTAEIKVIGCEMFTILRFIENLVNSLFALAELRAELK